MLTHAIGLQRYNMKGYFGGKKVLKVMLGSVSIYNYVAGGGGALPPPEVINIPPSQFLPFFLNKNNGEPSANSKTQMSDWIPVRSNVSYSADTYLTNACVVQVKNSSGVVTYLSEPSSNAKTENVVIPIGNNTHVRIYFYVGTNGRIAQDLILTELR